MEEKTVTVLGVKISIFSKNQILEEIKKYLEKIQNPKSKIQNPRVRPLVIFTPNPEIIVYAQDDENFRQILNQADLTLPDGWGVVWASQILDQKSKIKNQKSIEERISGVAFMEDLCQLAAEQSLRVGLIGGRRGVAVKALECLKRKYPGLEGWTEDGHYQDLRTIPGIERKKFRELAECVSPVQVQSSKWRMDELVEKIRKEQTSILFVGLGYPKQEYFILQLQDLRTIPGIERKKFRELALAKRECVSPALVLMSVGGAFDELSGRLPRCPKWLDDLGFKWLWRLVLEPWRLPRQLALIKFIFLVLKERLR